MLRFLAGIFMVAMRDLKGQVDLLSVAEYDGAGAERLTEFPQRVEEVLERLEKEVARVPFNRLILRKIRRLLGFIRNHDMTIAQIEPMLKELHNDIVDDLSHQLFLMVPEDRASLYRQPEPPFGENVAARFPNAAYDIAAAARCMALDEWTAAVFHLMRVLEKGLHSLATHLGLGLSSEIELENWKNIIDQIERGIRALEQTPKSASKTKALRFYSEAASQFRYFKDAWRNHVSHARAQYDEREALVIFEHVRTFMHDLAEDGPS